MSLKFKFIPLTFLNDDDEIKRQIRNTIILKNFYDNNKKTIKLNKLIEGSQYGYNASAQPIGKNKFLRISDITNGKVDWSTVPFCDCDNEGTYLIYPGDLLIARTGGTTGKSFLISDSPKSAIYAGYLIRIRANKDCKAEFLNLFLNSYAYWSQITSLNKDEFRPSINANKIKELILPLCTLDEQNNAINIANGQIVKGYEELDIKINKILNNYDSCKKILNEFATQKYNCQQLKQAILHEAMHGKLTANWREKNAHTESAIHLLSRIKVEKEKLGIAKKKHSQPIPPEERPFSLPNNWVWCRIGDIGIIQRGKSPKYDDEGTKLIINQKCVRWFTVDTSFCKTVSLDWYNKLPNEIRTDLNDILVNSTGEGTIGRSAIVQKPELGLLFDSHVLRIKALIEPNYIVSLINSNFGQAQIINLKGAKSTKQTELGVDNLSNILIPLPPIEEQKEINKEMNDLIQKCIDLEAEIKQNEIYAKKLMLSTINEAFESEPVNHEKFTIKKLEAVTIS